MAFRILIAINYSAGENTNGDSGFAFTAQLILSLLARDSSLHFYVLAPQDKSEEWTTRLSRPCVTIIPVPMVPRLHGGDFQFDPAELYRRFDFRRYDVDLLFLNQPELAPGFLQFFNRQTFHNVPAVCYVHWFDTRRPSTPKQLHHRPALIAALSGIVVSAATGCNSEFGRERILQQARQWFNSDTIEEMATKLVIFPPVVDVNELLAFRVDGCSKKVQLLINHRLLKYTGVRSLLTHFLPQMATRRRDFNVLATNPSKVRLPGSLTKVPWLCVKTLDRDNYLAALWKSDIVLAPHRAAHWSISTLEAICAQTVPLMNCETFFPEMMKPIIEGMSAGKRRHIESRWFYFRGNFSKRLSELIDKIDDERELAVEIGRRARLHYSWDAWSERWIELLHSVDRQVPRMSEQNPSMQKILKMIRDEGSLPKQELLRRMRWTPKTRALAWTSFRKLLREAAPDDPRQSEVVYRLVRRRSKPAGKRTRLHVARKPGSRV